MYIYIKSSNNDRQDAGQRVGVAGGCDRRGALGGARHDLNLTYIYTYIYLSIYVYIHMHIYVYSFIVSYL